MSFLDKLTGFGKSVSSAVSPFLSLASGVGSLFGNSNINKQIKAQQEENQKNRDWNLMLAQMQNQWSQNQWERENEYNTPLAQRKRLQDAGLNADLMYGNGGISNLAASSPAMTSGQGSSPTDVSVLGQKKTIGDMVRDAQATRLAEAQIKSVEAQTRKTAADAGISETQLEYEDAKQLIGLDLSRVQFDKNKREWQILANQIRESAASAEGMEYDTAMKKVDNLFHESKIKALINDLEKSADIKELEAEYLVKTLAMRILGLELSTREQQYDSQFQYLLDDSKTSDSISKKLLQAARSIRDVLFK